MATHDGTTHGGAAGSDVPTAAGRFHALDTVLVVRPMAPHIEVGGGWVGRRPPAVGDIGHVIDVLPMPAGPARYRVEAVDGAGAIVWVGEFAERELALADGHM